MKYNALYAAMLSMIIIFSNACGMEQQPKLFSTLRSQMNEVIKGNPKADQSLITQTIEEMRDAGILDKKHYYYDYVHNKETKPFIFQQFFTHYPEQICPELQSMVSLLDDFYERQDFLTILSLIKTESRETNAYIQQIKTFIKSKEEASEYKNKTLLLNKKTINKIYDALNIICSHLNQEYSPKEETIPISKDKTKNIALLIKIKKQQTTLGDLLPKEQLIYSPGYFIPFFNNIANSDPKDAAAMIRRQLWERRLEADAITCINAIVGRYSYRDQQLQAIEERFHDNSLFFLRKTAEHNEEILEQHQELFDYYQQMVTEPEQQESSSEESRTALPTLLLEPEAKSKTDTYTSQVQTKTLSTDVPTVVPTAQPTQTNRSTVVKNTPTVSAMNPALRFFTTVWNGVSTVLSTIYYGIKWIITEIRRID